VNVLGLRLLGVVALVAANAFFVAAEFALVASRRTRIEAMARRGDRKARTVRKALRELYRLLSATQLGITLTSILLGYVAEDTVAHLFRDWFTSLPASLNFLARGGIASVVAVGAISFLHVVFGELVPKTWAITYPEATSRWVAAPLIAFSWITRPFNFVLNASARALLRLLGIRSTNPEADRVHSPEELRMLVAESRKTGGLGAGDARLLEGVFEFSEKNAREVMTPRTAIVALPAEASLAEAADRVAAAGRSRYPVTGESLDDVIGIVHAKDILRGLLSGSEAPVQDVHAVLRHLRDHADPLNLDAERIGLLAESANVTVALSALMRDSALRCAALLCGFTIDLDGSTTVAAAAREYGFADACAGRSVDDLPADVPLLFVRAGRENYPGLNDALDLVVRRALARNLPLTLVNHAAGAHGFEVDEDRDISRFIVRQVLGFLAFHLKLQDGSMAEQQI
jgi:CBS domain-containing protein